MPYILISRREELYEKEDSTIDTAGELNFVLTCVVEDYLKTHGKDYKHLNDCIGALECAKLELYRRVVAPYEDQKCFDNGDVYADISR